MTDLISVTAGPVAQPPQEGVFAFDEDVATPRQVSAAWIDARHLSITIDEIGDVRHGPRRIDDVDISYVLGPSAGVAEAKRDASVEERRQWEQLKTSASWHYVESRYDADAHLIDHYQRFIDWAKANVTTRL